MMPDNNKVKKWPFLSPEDATWLLVHPKISKFRRLVLNRMESNPLAMDSPVDVVMAAIREYAILKSACDVQVGKVCHIASDHGSSWDDIALEVGVTRQTLTERYPTREKSDDRWPPTLGSAEQSIALVDLELLYLPIYAGKIEWDPQVGLDVIREVKSFEYIIEMELRKLVLEARHRGASWKEVAVRLGYSKSGAHRRYKRPDANGEVEMSLKLDLAQAVRAANVAAQGSEFSPEFAEATIAWLESVEKVFGVRAKDFVTFLESTVSEDLARYGAMWAEGSDELRDFERMLGADEPSLLGAPTGEPRKQPSRVYRKDRYV